MAPRRSDEPTLPSSVELRSNLLTAIRGRHQTEAHRLLTQMKQSAASPVERGWYLTLAGRFLTEFEPHKVRSIWRYYTRAKALFRDDPDGLGAVTILMVVNLKDRYRRALGLMEEWWATPFASESRYTPQLYQAHGNLLMRTGKLDQAEKSLQRAIKHYEGCEDCRCYLGGTWYTLGQIRRALGDARGALEAFRTAQAYMPPGDREWLFMARTWLDLMSGDMISAHVNYHLAMNRLRAVSPAFLHAVKTELGILSVALAEEGGAFEEGSHLRRALQRMSIAHGQVDPALTTFNLMEFRRALG